MVVRTKRKGACGEYAKWVRDSILERWNTVGNYILIEQLHNFMNVLNATELFTLKCLSLLSVFHLNGIISNRNFFLKEAI